MFYFWKVSLSGQDYTSNNIIALVFYKADKAQFLTGQTEMTNDWAISYN